MVLSGAAAVCAHMLSEVVTAGELLAALVALEGLLLCVKRSVMPLDVLLSAESAVAEIADKCLAGVFRERLLASTPVGRSRVGNQGQDTRGRYLGRGGASGSRVLLYLAVLTSRSYSVDGGHLAGVLLGTGGDRFLNTLVPVRVAVESR